MVLESWIKVGRLPVIVRLVVANVVVSVNGTVVVL
jgi:hypothetical protein